MTPEELVENQSNVPAPEAPKAAWWWMKNTKGKADAALTMMVLAFLVVTGSYGLSIIGELTVGAIHLVFSEFNIAYATAVLIPLMSLYFGRRWTDANAKNG